MSAQRQTVPIRQRQRELTRQSILQAALDLFSEQGFYYVSIDEIALRAGVGRTTFYLHFPDKSAVLRDLRDQRLSDWDLSGDYGWASGDHHALETFFGRMVDFYLETPSLYKILHEARYADPAFAEQHRTTMEGLLEVLGETGPLRGAPESQLRLVVAMLYAMIDHFLYLWLIQGWPIEREAAIKAMSHALRSTLV